MSDISQHFRPADILGVQQAIKGFDKSNFCEVFSKITGKARAEIRNGYLKNDLGLIFTVQI